MHSEADAETAKGMRRVLSKVTLQRFKDGEDGG
jgi:hypothetical protein